MRWLFTTHHVAVDARMATTASARGDPGEIFPRLAQPLSGAQTTQQRVLPPVRHRPESVLWCAARRQRSPPRRAACRQPVVEVWRAGILAGELRLGESVMRFVDLIECKKAGGSLTSDELRWAIGAYLEDKVPDYQMAALLMAIRWRGLSDSETVALTEAMVTSGETYDFDDLDGALVDKHSTGGVGDKVSLILAPMAAAAGCTVPMVSGRGLGHTGGTLDKLESIPGLRTDLSAPAFRDQLQHIGVAMGAQTATFVPADKRLYALRDVTGTVDDTGLITASILSKKIAEGASALVLDVKVGRGAFFADIEDARSLADRIVAVAGGSGLRCSAMITAMEQPLGNTVGNALEMAESIDVLSGRGPSDVRALTLELGAEMLQLGGITDDHDDALRRVTGCPRQRRRCGALRSSDPGAGW